MQVDCVGPGPREQECGARGRQGKSLDSPVATIWLRETMVSRPYPCIFRLWTSHSGAGGKPDTLLGCELNSKPFCLHGLEVVGPACFGQNKKLSWGPHLAKVSSSFMRDGYKLGPAGGSVLLLQWNCSRSVIRNISSPELNPGERSSHAGGGTIRHKIHSAEGRKVPCDRDFPNTSPLALRFAYHIPGRLILVY